MFWVLLKDELNGFYRSKAIIALWIGLPVLTFLIYWLTPNVKGMPFGVFFAAMISGIGGTIASVLLAINIIHEISRNVYELFLVRPIKREYLLLSKFIAVFICLFIAVTVSLLIGFIVDLSKAEISSEDSFIKTLEAFGYSLTTILVSSALGIFIGVISPSVLMGIILIIFFSSNVSSILLLLPTMLDLSQPLLFTFLISFVASILLVMISLSIFKNKQF